MSDLPQPGRGDEDRVSATAQCDGLRSQGTLHWRPKPMVDLRGRATNEKDNITSPELESGC